MTSLDTLDPRTLHAPADPAVDALVERLQQHAAENANGRCVVLFDPSVRKADDDRYDGPLLQVRTRTPIIIPRPNFPLEHRPYLMDLNLAHYRDAEVLRASVRMALEDRVSTAIGRSQGQRVGGWLSTNTGIIELARHMARHTVQGRPGTFRYYDMRCLVWLWSRLRPEQQQALFGPITCWHVLDVTHNLLTLQPQPGEHPSNGELNLDDTQWDALRRVGAINRALAAYQHEKGQVPHASQLSCAWDAAGRALRYGFSDPEDAAVLVLHALQWHPLLDTHPTIAALIQKRVGDQHYRFLVADLEPADFQRICHEWQTHSVQGGA